MRVDEIIEKVMIVYACLPIYWFLKLGYWAWFDPNMLEKVLKYSRYYPPGVPIAYFDKKRDNLTFKFIFVLLLGIFFAIGLLIISSFIARKIQ